MIGMQLRLEDLYSNLLIGISQILELQTARRDHLCKCLALATFPTRIVEKLVEDDDCSRCDAIRQRVEYRLSRRIQVGIHMHKRHRPRILARKLRHGLIEPALVQDHIAANLRQLAAKVECSLLPVEKIL